MSNKKDIETDPEAPGGTAEVVSEQDEAAGPAEDGKGAAPAPAQAEGPAEEEPDYRQLYLETNDRLLRARAEFENYRKRVQREFVDIRELAKLGTVQEFLTVYDHFCMAMEHAANGTGESGSLRQGMELIRDEFGRTLETLGVNRIDAAGEPFNPDEHEAIAQEASDSVPEGHVVRQWKAGFRLGERLVRPAVVVVSTGPAEDGGEADDANASGK